LDGEGVPRDEAEALKWFLFAAEKGVAASQYNVGGIYARGKAVKEDWHEAVKWFLKSAEQGYVPAQFTLGSAYCYGFGGVPIDNLEGLAWLGVAAEGGSQDAIKELEKFHLDPDPDNKNSLIMKIKKRREEIRGEVAARKLSADPLGEK